MSGGFVRGRSVDHRHEVQAAARSADCHWGADTGQSIWISPVVWETAPEEMRGAVSERATIHGTIG